MVDYSVFDSILDSAFVVDGEGKIIYANDAAATLCQTSVRRMVGKANLADLIQLEEKILLPFTEDSPGRIEPSPFIETEFAAPKAGRKGRLQVAVRPLDSEHWAFFMRDVSLEEALHSKYRSELLQKEEYARNLEKLVEARTAELRALNQTLNAILNSLGQGFFTFGSDGVCGTVYTKACQDILGSVPVARKATEVLGVPASEIGQFRSWCESMFSEVLPFEDLRGLGPDRFTAREGRHVVLEYYPIRKEDASVGSIVVVATDKTAEFEAQKALEAERQYAGMVVRYMKNKDQFLQFLASVRKTLAALDHLASTTMSGEAVSESFRILHTLEGEAGIFSVRSLREKARSCQAELEPGKGSPVLDEAARAKYLATLTDLRRSFGEFLSENRDIFKLPEGEVSRVVELPMTAIHSFLEQLQRQPAADKLVRQYQDLFLRVSLEDCLRYYDGLARSVAERLGKKLKPLQIEGGELRIFAEPYQKLFSALVHAFRNAVDHGLETPEEREWGGKDPAGQLRVEARQQSGWMSISISDDGRGIDPAVIRAKLLERFPEIDFSQQSDEEVIQNVCRPGFSSREDVGEFSGRGVGLDALREEVLRLQGHLRVKSEVGAGTVIEIKVPEVGLDVPLLRSA